MKKIVINLKETDPLFIRLNKIQNKFVRSEFIRAVLLKATENIEDGIDVFNVIVDSVNNNQNSDIKTKIIEENIKQEKNKINPLKKELDFLKPSPSIEKTDIEEGTFLDFEL